MTIFTPFFTHNYTMLYQQYAGKLDAACVDILDNAKMMPRIYKCKILGDITVFDLPIESDLVKFHHIRSLCYLERAIAIYVIPPNETFSENTLTKEPDFLAARSWIWSDETQIRDAIFVNKELPNCKSNKEVTDRLTLELRTDLPFDGESTRLDGYIDQDFPISALLHIQRFLGCDPYR